LGYPGRVNIQIIKIFILLENIDNVDSIILDTECVTWTLRSSVLVVFNNFLLINAPARRKISSDQKRFFIALGLYPLSFFANTPFLNNKVEIRK